MLFYKFYVSYKAKRLEIYINVFYGMNVAKIVKE